jgi:hypothetical protein
LAPAMKTVQEGLAALVLWVWVRTWAHRGPASRRPGRHRSLWEGFGGNRRVGPSEGHRNPAFPLQTALFSLVRGFGKCGYSNTALLCQCGRV